MSKCWISRACRATLAGCAPMPPDKPAAQNKNVVPEAVTGRGDRVVKPLANPWAKFVALFVVVSLVASCGLPRVGPNKREIFAGSVQKEGDAFIVSVNDRVTRATAVVPALGFSEAFIKAGPLGSDTIQAGDSLGLT